MRRLEREAFDRAAFAERYGPWAVIAGASEGTGADFAEQLAAMGLDLVLVSRRAEALEALGHQLSAKHGIRTRAIAADLTEADAAARLLDATGDLDIGLYVSNAGAGMPGSFLDTPLEDARRLLTMNCATVLEAVHRFGRRFRDRGKGGIVIMSSGAGLGGQAHLAMYTATKGFEINLAESLWEEFSGLGIDVIGVCAPVMNTPTLRRTLGGVGFDLDKICDPADVVHAALAGLGRKPLVVVPDGPVGPDVEEARRQRQQALAVWARGFFGGAA